MDSRARMLTALEGDIPDHVPCSFMLFYTLYDKCRSDEEFVEEQIIMSPGIKTEF